MLAVCGATIRRSGGGLSMAAFQFGGDGRTSGRLRFQLRWIRFEQMEEFAIEATAMGA